MPGYIAAQVLGTCAEALFYIDATGATGWTGAVGLVVSGYGDTSQGRDNLASGVVTEVAMTFFLLIILGTTAERAPQAFAPIALGFRLTLIHPISIPVTNPT